MYTTKVVSLCARDREVHRIGDFVREAERGFLRGALAEVSRQKAHARGGAAVGERDAELAPDAGGSGDAWDDPNLVPARHERLHLLAAAAEHQRIAALEPDDGRAAAGETGAFARSRPACACGSPTASPRTACASGETRSKIAGATRRSYITTSAVCIRW